MVQREVAALAVRNVNKEECPLTMNRKERRSRGVFLFVLFLSFLSHTAKQAKEIAIFIATFDLQKPQITTAPCL